MEIFNYEAVDLKATRPPKEMSDEMWQKYFIKMKKVTKQSIYKKMNVGSFPITVNGRNAKSYFVYDGETQWYRYCQFINDILNTIRKQEHDYCFFIYQISELLSFEHDSLRTKWLPDSGCFEIWLD